MLKPRGTWWGCRKCLINFKSKFVTGEYSSLQLEVFHWETFFSDFILALWSISLIITTPLLKFASTLYMENPELGTIELESNSLEDIFLLVVNSLFYVHPFWYRFIYFICGLLPRNQKKSLRITSCSQYELPIFLSNNTRSHG